MTIIFTPESFYNKFREDYPTMGFKETKEFLDKILPINDPGGKKFYANPETCVKFFSTIKKPVTVDEMGGCIGHLAQRVMFTNSFISKWTNYEMSHYYSTIPQICKYNEYNIVELNDYMWNTDIKGADIFVSTHTVEHISRAQFDKLAEFLSSRYKVLYLEIPIPKYPINWKDYYGMHVLEAGWDYICDKFDSLGFSWEAMSDFVYVFYKKV